jgi:hypothetical protein
MKHAIQRQTWSFLAGVVDGRPWTVAEILPVTSATTTTEERGKIEREVMGTDSSPHLG